MILFGFLCISTLLNCSPASCVKMSWNLRVRGPGGQATLAASPDTAISQLQQQIEEKLGVPVHLQELLGGFPPKQLQVRQHDMVALVMLAALHAQVFCRAYIRE